MFAEDKVIYSLVVIRFREASYLKASGFIIDFGLANVIAMSNINAGSDWMLELDRLQEFFKATPLPEAPVKIGGYARITDVNLFINTNLLRARSNPGSAWHQACLLRLLQLEAVLLGS